MGYRKLGRTSAHRKAMLRNLGRKSLEEVKIKLQELELGFKEE